MNDLNNDIISLMKKNNCNIVGFADLRCLSNEVRQSFDSGIVIALSYTKESMEDNKNGDMIKYYDELNAMNQKLDELGNDIENHLINQGYKAFFIRPTSYVSDENWNTILPYKTVATLAGIGWIGKCAMLVTHDVGSALRLRVILTNAQLEYGTPITESKCPKNCNVCSDICPGNAPLGGDTPLWKVGVDRDSFYDAHACRSAAREYAKEKLNISETICGLCISNCPFTKKALSY